MAKGKKRNFQSQEPISEDNGLFAEAALSLGFSAEPEEQKQEQAPKEHKKTEKELSLTGQRAGLRIEKKGRRGKTVTVIDGLTLGEDSLGLLAKQLRKAMGCGSSVEGPSVVLQGDNRERIASWLRSKGVRVNF